MEGQDWQHCRKPLDEWQTERVVATQGEEAIDRIRELETHTVMELGDHVHALANEVPPKETILRREIYGWDVVGAEIFQLWGKKELIRRIIMCEQHDEARRSWVIGTGE